MSSLPVSSHIPDPDLITLYAERKGSFFSSVSPWTKLAALALLVVAVTVLQSPPLLVGLYLAVLCVFALAGLPVAKLFRWYLVPLVFVLSLVGILAWTQPGNPVLAFSLGGVPLVLTDSGILLVAVLSLKTLTTVTFSLFFLMTTRYEHLAGMISRALPAPLDQIFLMAYRFFLLALAMAGSVLKAVRSRGGGLVRGIRTEGGLFAEVIGLLFIRSFDRAERVEKAMAARGYQGSYASAVPVPPPSLAGYVLIALFTVLVVAGARLGPGGW